MSFHKLPLAVAIVVAMGGSSAAYAVAFVGMETEPNNTFGDRDLLTPGTYTYQGELGLGTPYGGGGGGPGHVDPFFYSEGFLTNGNVDHFNLDGLSPGDDVQVFLNNAPYGPTNNPDTILGVFDNGGTLLASADNYSSIQGLSSNNFVNPDGTLDIGVTGRPDYDFEGVVPGFGPHAQSGDYDITIFLNAPPVDPEGNVLDDGQFDGYDGGLIEGDVDFVQFSGLTPGEMFRVELIPTPAGFPPADQEALFLTGGLIGLFDADGTLVAADKAWDDGLTMLGGIVPTSGNIHVAVTGAGDDGGWDDGTGAFDGTSFRHDTGAYDLLLETFNLADAGADISDIVVLPDAPDAQGNPCGGSPSCFGFGGLEVNDGEIVNLDPDVAIGYTFDIVTGPGLFASILLPSVGADTDFWISIAGCGASDGFAATAGTLYNFMTECGTNVDIFEVSEIDVAEGLDPNNPIAFVTQVTFDITGTYDVSMTPQTVWVPNNATVPEPTTLALFSIGLAGFGFAGKRRKKSN